MLHRSTLLYIAFAAGLAQASEPSDARTDTTLNLRAFGAKCDDRTDDTDAIMAWLARLRPGQRGYMPAGTCLFTEPLQIATDRIALDGDGPYQSVLKYAGRADNVNLLTLGDGTRPLKNWSLKSFRITSSIKMKRGSALHAKLLVRSMIEGVVIDGQDGAGNLFDGIWFDGVDQVIYRSMEARAKGDAVRVNGIPGRGNPKADLFIQGGKIAHSGVGLHIGGAFGGLYVDQLNIIANGKGVLIDTTLAEEANRELFFGSLVAIDSPKAGPAVMIADRLAGPASWTQFNGTWLASGSDDGVLIETGVKSTVLIQGGTIFNFKRDGIRNQSSQARVLVNGVSIRYNQAFGVNNTAGSPNVIVESAFFIKNKLGDAQGTIQRK